MVGLSVMKKLGPTQQKIILLLLGGLALCFARTPKQYFKVLKGVSREWQKINRRQLKRVIAKFHETHLIYMKYNKDGSLTPVLTPEGKRIALHYQVKSLKIEKPKIWDRLWRVIVFDIPEKEKWLRDVFRNNLKRLGFREFQKSVFIFPYPCEKEISFLIKIYNAEKFIKKMIVKEFDGIEKFKNIYSI